MTDKLPAAVWLTMILLSSTAWCQAISSGVAPVDGLAEVVVTAQRRAQNLQDVPVAVTSFSMQDLDQQQSVSTLDLARLVPNMFGGNNVGTGSANAYYIRSLGQVESFPTFEPQVGTYVDDIYISRQNANNFALFDIDQVQVLRGPQGTLFGRNSTGGAVVLTLNKPSATFGGYVEGGYGKDDRFFGRASVDIPVNSEFLTKTSFFGLTDHGYVDDLTTGQRLNYDHDWGVREAIRVLPAAVPNLAWDLSLDYAYNDSSGVLNFPAADGQRISYSGFRTDSNLSPYLTGYKATRGQGTDVASWGAMSNLSMTFDAGMLNVITGFRALHENQQVDFPDSALGPLVPYDQSPTGQFALAVDLNGFEYTQEFKWTGHWGDRLKYTAGLYYLYEVNDNDFGAVLNLGAVVGIPGITYFPAVFADEYTRNTTDSKAAYLQFDYALTDGLTFTAGTRYTGEVKGLHARPDQPDNPAAPGFTTAQIEAAGWDTKLNASELTPHFALQYQADPRLMFYASATRGFQGGGWNGLTNTAQTYNDFGPETLWSYELGSRFETADHRLRLNNTLFYEDVKHYQLLADVPQADNFVTTNAADLESYGLETEISWRPINPLTITANIGLQYAHYLNPSVDTVNQQIACRAAPGISNTACGQGIVTADGALAPPAYLSHANVALSGVYHLEFSRFSLTPSVGVQWVSAHPIDTVDDTLGRDPAYASLDMGIDFQMNDAPWKLTVECKDCTMKDWGTFAVFGYRYFNRPGIWDLKATYKF